MQHHSTIDLYQVGTYKYIINQEHSLLILKVNLKCGFCGFRFFRTLNTLAAAATLGLQELNSTLDFLHPTPAAESLAQTAQVAHSLAEQAVAGGPSSEAAPAVMPVAVAVGGRRLK
jgi:hypothetical protein